MRDPVARVSLYRLAAHFSKRVHRAIVRQRSSTSGNFQVCETRHPAVASLAPTTKQQFRSNSQPSRAHLSVSDRMKLSMLYSSSYWFWSHRSPRFSTIARRPLLRAESSPVAFLADVEDWRRKDKQWTDFVKCTVIASERRWSTR